MSLFYLCLTPPPHWLYSNGMSCTSPIFALDLGIDAEGKHKVKILGNTFSNFNVSHFQEIYGDDFLMLPCGHCLSCQHDHKAEWSVRCELEAKLHVDNCFVTLTYDDSHVPNKLIKAHLQRFIKRLRKIISPLKIRYFACGEYGSRTARPHYHLIVFGWKPTDMKFFKSDGSNLLCTSKLLDSVWNCGFVTVSDFTPATASYVAGYVNKKMSKMPGFLLMSTRPGIGKVWLDNNRSILGNDSIVLSNGRIAPLPRYFDKVLTNEGYDLTDVKNMRKEKVSKILLQKMNENHYQHQELLWNNKRFLMKDRLERSKKRGL